MSANCFRFWGTGVSPLNSTGGLPSPKQLGYSPQMKVPGDATRRQ